MAIKGITHHSGLNVGSGGNITGILVGSVSVDPASIAAGAEGTTAVTIAGCNPGDVVVMNPPAAGITAGLGIRRCYVSAANTVSLVLGNTSGGAIDQAAGAWSYAIIRLS